MKSSQVLLIILLLVVSFMAGAAWSSNSDTSGTENRKASDGQPALEVADVGAIPQDLTPAELATIHLFENAAPSVVFITTLTVQRNYWTRNIFEIPSGTGSGFVWNDEGYIVTNFHVVKGSSRVQVTLSDQSTWDAEVVGSAPSKDLAVLKVDAPAERLHPLIVGTSQDLRVGQFVYAIGNPFGLDQTLTTGVISALGREITSLGQTPIRDVIQTDAAINPGNSGGPLLNSSGELIGVNTQIYSPSGASAGIGFSIPVDEVRWVVPDLIEHGKIQRPVMGIVLATNNNVRDLGIKGALILDVVENGPAEQSGLQPTYRDRRGRIRLGDVITGINDQQVASNSDLILALEDYKPGDQVQVRVLREKEEVVLPVVLSAAEQQ